MNVKQNPFMNMKKQYAALLAVLIAPVLAFAQLPPTDEATGKYTFMDKVMAEKLKAKEIVEVVTKYGKDETNATGKEQKWEIAETEADMVKFNAKMTVSYPGTKGGTNLEGTISFTVRVDAKDGKYRYIITDFEHSEAHGSGGKLELVSAECGTSRMAPASWKKIKGLVTTQTNAIVEDIKRIVREYENDPARNDDW